jgi:predicted nucleic acid-binding protein
MIQTNQTEAPHSSQSDKEINNINNILTQIAVSTVILGGICYLSKTNPHVNGIVKKGVDIAGNISTQKMGEFVDRTETIIVDGISSVANEVKTQAQTHINNVAAIIKDIVS